MSLNTRKSQDMDNKTLASNVDRCCERYMKWRNKIRYLKRPCYCSGIKVFSEWHCLVPSLEHIRIRCQHLP